MHLSLSGCVSHPRDSVQGQRLSHGLELWRGHPSNHPWERWLEAALKLGVGRSRLDVRVGCSQGLTPESQESLLKVKLVCYSRYLLTSYFYISVPYNENYIFFWC